MSKILITGGGVAGLSAGIFALGRGFDCEIFEKNAYPGGNLTGWKRNGCMIDNCIHWLTGSADGNSLNDIWRETGLLGKDTKLFRSDNFYVSKLGENEVGLSADPETTRWNFIRLSPVDTHEINRFTDTAKCFAAVSGTKKATQKAAAFAPHLSDILYYYRHSLYEVADRFSHPLLRKIFTDYIGGEFSAIMLVAAYGAFISGNGSVPYGGSAQAAKRMEERFVSLGGVFHRSAPVSKIITRGNVACGIILEDGSTVYGDYVICATDPDVTFGKLLPRTYMPRYLADMYNDPKTPVFSSIHAAFVCDSEALGKFGTKIIPCRPLSSRNDGRLAVREFSHEPEYAPDGKTVIQCLVFQNEQESREWISAEKSEYEAKKSRAADTMLDALLSEFPALKDSIKLIDFWTPRTYSTYHGAYAGAYMSFVTLPSFSLRKLPPRIPKLKNVSLATQWQRPPGGLPNAAVAGKESAEFACAFLERQMERRHTGHRIPAAGGI